MSTVIVLAKRPVAGRVKTRLCPPLTPHAAAQLAGAALTDTLDVVDSTGAADRLLAFDGETCGWLRRGWRARPQCSGGLDLRLAHAFRGVRGAAQLVGMDTPQLDAAMMSMFDPSRFDACLGPAEDGGYWTVGLRDPGVASAAFTGVPMSTERTFAAQHDRLRALGLSVQLLPPLVDVDTIDDAQRVASRAPTTRFAVAFSSVAAAVCA